MCVCTPEKRTPFCGARGCEWPKGAELEPTPPMAPGLATIDARPLATDGQEALDAWQREIHAWAKSKGWWDGPRNTGELLALIHSEVSEALEEYRSGRSLQQTHFSGDHKPEGFGIELADAVIRILDTAEALGLSIGALIATKMAYNETRPHRHGGKLA